MFCYNKSVIRTTLLEARLQEMAYNKHLKRNRMCNKINTLPSRCRQDACGRRKQLDITELGKNLKKSGLTRAQVDTIPATPKCSLNGFSAYAVGKLNRRQGYRLAERLDERTFIGHAFTRDIKSRSVIDRCANDGQANSNVHACF